MKSIYNVIHCIQLICVRNLLEWKLPRKLQRYGLTVDLIIALIKELNVYQLTSIDVTLVYFCQTSSRKCCYTWYVNSCTYLLTHLFPYRRWVKLSVSLYTILPLAVNQFYPSICQLPSLCTRFATLYQRSSRHRQPQAMEITCTVASGARLSEVLPPFKMKKRRTSND